MRDKENRRFSDSAPFIGGQKEYEGGWLGSEWAKEVEEREGQ